MNLLQKFNYNCERHKQIEPKEWIVDVVHVSLEVWALHAAAILSSIADGEARIDKLNDLVMLCDSTLKEKLAGILEQKMKDLTKVQDE